MKQTFKPVPKADQPIISTDSFEDTITDMPYGTLQSGYRKVALSERIVGLYPLIPVQIAGLASVALSLPR